MNARQGIWQAGAEFCFAIFDRAGRLVGGCAINQIEPNTLRGNLGYWVRTSATGRGYGSTAARCVARFGLLTLGLQRLEIVAAMGNVGSQHAAIKAGATREGILRNRIRIRDVQWLYRYLGRITDAQLRDALIASGATGDEAARFAESLRALPLVLEGYAAGRWLVAREPVLTGDVEGATARIFAHTSVAYIHVRNLECSNRASTFTQQTAASIATVNKSAPTTSPTISKENGEIAVARLAITFLIVQFF